MKISGKILEKLFKTLLFCFWIFALFSSFLFARDFSAESILPIQEKNAPDPAFDFFLEACRSADTVAEGRIREILVTPVGFDYASVPLAMITFENLIELRGSAAGEKTFPFRDFQKTRNAAPGDTVMVILKRIGKSGKLEIQDMVKSGPSERRQAELLLSA